MGSSEMSSGDVVKCSVEMSMIFIINFTLTNEVHYIKLMSPNYLECHIMKTHCISGLKYFNILNSVIVSHKKLENVTL